MPALSEKDKADLRFGVENEVDMIFASFIRKAQDIDEIRQCLGPAGEKPWVFIVLVICITVQAFLMLYVTYSMLK